MPPKACIEQGCDDRMKKLEEDMEHVQNPESGAIGQLHEKVNSKVSFSLFMWVIAGCFAFTSIATGALYISEEKKSDKQDKHIAEVNAAQDRRIEEILNEVRAMRKDSEETRITVSEAVVSINAHRAYTEGWGKKGK